MRISNSKKQLAKIIHENGGWRDGSGWAAQDKRSWGADNLVVFYYEKPTKPETGGLFWPGDDTGLNSSIVSAKLLPNWHQTLLSRDEYLHLYPVPVEVVVENKTACHLTVTDKPTLEQLAADYRNAKDYADRKQQEADDAKADAEAKLAELVAAGKALGLVLSVADVPEPEPVITDWRDLRVGDIIWWGGDEDNAPGEYEVEQLEDADYDGYLTIAVGSYWVHYESDEWRFIRRPAKGGADA